MDDPLSPLANECFFIAPIGDEGTPIRKRSDGILKFIVSRAAEELGLTAVRADQISSPGQITVQVIDHILRARAAVADLTGQNPNVFYELAIRHTARLPVALIVSNDDPPLPFDIFQMRTIMFDHTDLDSADQCRQDIVKHLQQALEGAVDSPIANTLDLRALQGGNQLERNIAELVTRIEDLSRQQQQTVETVRAIAGWDHLAQPSGFSSGSGSGKTYAEAVGDRLHSVRLSKDLSLQDIEELSGKEFKTSVLGAYERGERSIAVPRLQRLALFYGVPVDYLLPRISPSVTMPPAEDGTQDRQESSGRTPDPEAP
jgi:hypothetical protein